MSTITPITQHQQSLGVHGFPASGAGGIGPYNLSGGATSRTADLQMKKQLEMSIEETAKTKARLEHMLLEVNERLGFKPDGDAA